MGGDVIINIQNLTKVFEKGDKRVVAIDGLNLSVFKNEFFCIVGPSGCGKTTLLKIIAGLEKPTSGKVLLEGVEVEGPGVDRGMVFQEFGLFPWRNVTKNIEFGLEIKGWPKKRRDEAAKTYINLIGLKGFEHSHPRELSSGMKQRVAIARALVNDPKVLLMDEPFGSLDAQTRWILHVKLLEVWSKLRKTVLFVTHNVEEAVYLADRVTILSKRPAKVIKTIKIDLKRPRNKLSSNFIKYREEIIDVLRTEVPEL